MTFDEFDGYNEARTVELWHKGGAGAWPPELWALAAVGEAGEVANAMKKLIRGDGTKQAVFDEIGDTIAYLSLLAQSMGTTLESCVVGKFNAVSERCGSSITLPKKDGGK